MIAFSGVSSQESAHGQSQKFEFGAALNQKLKSHGRCVSADVNFSESSPKILT